MSAGAWCDMSDLPSDQCGLPCCAPPAPAEASSARSGFRRGGGPVIEATTHSTCDECGERIRPGEQITKTDDHDYWIHKECP